jgi:hypothetical protein
MATNAHPEFDREKVQQTLDAAQAHGHTLRAASGEQAIGLNDGTLKLGATCISVTVENNQVCLNLPLGIGSVCLPVPGWVPNGTAVQACLDICTKWGIPCGVEVTVSLAGQLIVKQGFGCSC